MDKVILIYEIALILWSDIKRKFEGIEPEMVGTKVEDYFGFSKDSKVGMARCITNYLNKGKSVHLKGKLSAKKLYLLDREINNKNGIVINAKYQAFLFGFLDTSVKDYIKNIHVEKRILDGTYEEQMKTIKSGVVHHRPSNHSHPIAENLIGSYVGYYHNPNHESSLCYLTIEKDIISLNIKLSSNIIVKAVKGRIIQNYRSTLEIFFLGDNNNIPPLTLLVYSGGISSASKSSDRVDFADDFPELRLSMMGVLTGIDEQGNPGSTRVLFRKVREFSNFVYRRNFRFNRLQYLDLEKEKKTTVSDLKDFEETEVRLFRFLRRAEGNLILVNRDSKIRSLDKSNDKYNKLAIEYLKLFFANKANEGKKTSVNQQEFEFLQDVINSIWKSGYYQTNVLKTLIEQFETFNKNTPDSNHLVGRLIAYLNFMTIVIREENKKIPELRFDSSSEPK